uniref:Putative secreted peptide n=1 Tax=Rhipicephalus pulchellus TaxID=72859 RepID=L7M8W0_RHIPC
MFRMPFPFLACLLGIMTVLWLSVTGIKQQAAPKRKMCNPYEPAQVHCRRPEERRYFYDKPANKCKEINVVPCTKQTSLYTRLTDCLKECAPKSPCRTPVWKKPANTVNGEYYTFDPQERECYLQYGEFYGTEENMFERRYDCKKTCSPTYE